MPVRSDSVTALTILVKMKATGSGTNRIARELALDLGSSSYFPAVISHTPGIANVTADPDFAAKVCAPDSLDVNATAGKLFLILLPTDFI